MADVGSAGTNTLLRPIPKIQVSRSELIYYNVTTDSNEAKHETTDPKNIRYTIKNLKWLSQNSTLT